MEKPSNAKMIAVIAMEIHKRQQLKMLGSQLSDHKYLFIESLASCLREWFNERDKLRFSTGGARRWTGYILFLMEMYLHLKSIDLTGARQKAASFHYKSGDDESSDDSTDYNCSNVDNNSADDEVSRAFSSEPSDPEEAYVPKGAEISMFTTTNQLASLDIERKINNSFLSKQQKQFSNLLLDSCQVILSNPTSTPAEIECLQTVLSVCGNDRNFALLLNHSLTTKYSFHRKIS